MNQIDNRASDLKMNSLHQEAPDWLSEEHSTGVSNSCPLDDFIEYKSCARDNLMINDNNNKFNPTDYPHCCRI